MRRLWLPLTILAGLLLAACNQAAAPAGSTPTGAVKPAFPPTEDAQAVKMECTVVSGSPTPEPTLQSAFPAPTAEDWSLGNASDPTLTILEYSDFQ